MGVPTTVGVPYTQRRLSTWSQAEHGAEHGAAQCVTWNRALIKERWPMSQFVPVAKVSELSPGQMKMVVADRERLLLVNMAGTFYVVSDTCGHDWAPLSRGKLEGHVIVCPRHFARYDVRTGQLLSGPLADDVPIYEVRIAEDTVYVKL